MPLEDSDQSSFGALIISPIQIQANRYQLLSRVVDGLAHEVKNPIHAAVINLELLRRLINRPDPALMLERVDLLEQEVESVHDLIDALFRFLRPSEPEEWVSLDEAIGGIMPMLHAYCRVGRVEISHEPSNAMLVTMDRAAVQQVILNLVVNAVDAMHPAGGKIEIRGTLQGEEVQLRIRDTGPGFPVEVGSRLDEPGAPVPLGAAGLGLAVTRHLAEEAGGRIQIEEPDGGATGACLLLAFSKASA
jgi:signal transduction histidine kinase